MMVTQANGQRMYKLSPLKQRMAQAYFKSIIPFNTLNSKTKINLDAAISTIEMVTNIKFADYAYGYSIISEDHNVLLQLTKSHVLFRRWEGYRKGFRILDKIERKASWPEKLKDRVIAYTLHPNTKW